MMPAGIHFVRFLRRGKPALWYVYAWRGGPQILKAEGARPKLDEKLLALAADAQRNRRRLDTGTLDTLITGYRGSPEWNKLAASTRASWSTWHQRIRDKFGDTPLEVLIDRRFRGDVLDWRDQWAHQPRAADLAIQTFSRVLSWGVDRGKLESNVLAGVQSLYEADRSDIIWQAAEFEKFNAGATPELQEAIELAACTGLRRGDLVNVPWDAVGDHAIIWQTSKSRGRARIVIPLLPETRQLLSKIKARHAAFMENQRPNRRKPLPETILANSYWKAWTASGLGSRFNDVKKATGLQVNLHDLRGTFATRCMIAGLTDQEIADMLGWTSKEVSMIRVRYVDQARVVVAIGERISKATVKGL